MRPELKCHQTERTLAEPAAVQLSAELTMNREFMHHEFVHASPLGEDVMLEGPPPYSAHNITPPPGPLRACQRA